MSVGAYAYNDVDLTVMESLAAGFGGLAALIVGLFAAAIGIIVGLIGALIGLVARRRRRCDDAVYCRLAHPGDYPDRDADAASEIKLPGSRGA